jgi:hypothetical protein
MPQGNPLCQGGTSRWLTDEQDRIEPLEHGQILRLTHRRSVGPPTHTATPTTASAQDDNGACCVSQVHPLQTHIVSPATRTGSGAWPSRQRPRPRAAQDRASVRWAHWPCNERAIHGYSPGATTVTQAVDEPQVTAATAPTDSVPKLNMRVRFPSSAPHQRPRSGDIRRTWASVVPRSTLATCPLRALSPSGPAPRQPRRRGRRHPCPGACGAARRVREPAVDASRLDVSSSIT